MKLAVFGATGTVGSALVGKALAAGHELRVLARTPAKLTGTDSRLTVIAGNAKDPAAVRRTVAGTPSSARLRTTPTRSWRGQRADRIPPSSPDPANIPGVLR
jgi:NAD(P)-dependent dehydrogenase (short-subunit alcohol dehydrogenase family)